MNEKLVFSDTENEDRNLLIEEAIETVLYADVPLSKKETKTSASKKKQATEKLQRLKTEVAEFSPKLDIVFLTSKDFSLTSEKSNTALEKKLDENNFYLINIPITLFPRSGWAFTRLECRISFNDGNIKASKLPIIYDIFPDDVWMNVLEISDHLNLGINESLNFQAQVANIETKSQLVNAKLDAGIHQASLGQATFIAGPFRYRFRRTKIRSRGRLSPECFWRLDGNEFVDEEDLLLSVILMVPKNQKNDVSAIGELRAYHDFQVFSAELKDFSFPESIKSFFSRGAVIHTQTRWKNIIKS